MGDAEAAFAFMARRAGTRTMPVDRWAHTMSLELGWMAPREAKAFVARALAAGLLAEEVDGLRFVLDPRGIEVQRGFRPAPDASMDPVARGAARASSAAPEAPSARPPEASSDPIAAPEAPTRTPPSEAGAAPPSGPTAGPGPQEDRSTTWLHRVGEATGKDRAAVLAAVAARQEEFHGLLSSEAALLLLAKEAGLDVREAAAAALTDTAPARG